MAKKERQNLRKAPIGRFIWWEGDQLGETRKRLLIFNRQ